MERRMRQFHDRIMNEYDDWIKEQPQQVPEEDEEPQEYPELPENEDAPPPPKIDI